LLKELFNKYFRNFKRISFDLFLNIVLIRNFVIQNFNLNYFSKIRNTYNP